MAKDRQNGVQTPDSVISIIGPGMKVVGDLTTEGTVRVEGFVEGGIQAGKARPGDRRKKPGVRLRGESPPGRNRGGYTGCSR